MRYISSIIFCFLFYSGTLFADCSGAEDEAYGGYRDAKRAYNSEDLESCQTYALKAKRHGSYVEDEASSCSCSGVEDEAYDGYRDAKRAYNSEDLESCQAYARKAYKHFSYAEDEANSCY